MDFHKPRYTPMSRRRRIYEGKAKVLYEGPEPGTLIQHFKDDATAFNAKKHEVIEGKGVLNNRISEYVFQHLNDIGVPTHFIRRLNMREQLIREVEIIPLEVVVRNVAAGSLAQRLGIEEGTQLPRSIIEFYYKNDKLNDPMVSEEHITAFGWASPQEIDDIMALAIRVNDFLSGLFLGVGIRLVDFKMETGRLWENDVMRIVVADEISPDSCRLWDIKTNDKLDKDRFRRDLGGLVEAYTEVAKRLGIMSEGERPQGTGPVLVKGEVRNIRFEYKWPGKLPGHLILEFQILLELIGQADQAHHQRVAEFATVIEASADRPSSRRTSHAGLLKVDVPEFCSRGPVRGKHMFDAKAGSPADPRLAFDE